MTLQVTGGDNQPNKYPDQLLGPVTITAVDTASQTAISGYALSVTAPPGVVAPQSLTTDFSGKAQFTPRLGLALGTATITVAGATSNTVSVHETATAPPSGTIFTIMNTSPASPGCNPCMPPAQFPLPATTAVSSGQNVTSDGNGTIYLTDFYYVGKITSDGMLYSITDPTKGGGSASGNQGPPAGAGYAVSTNSGTVRGMGFVAPGQLVVAGAVSGVVDGFREIDFTNNVIFAYAGGGTATGTGILANTANIDGAGYPNVLAGFGNGGMYFYNENYTPAFLNVDSSGLLNAWTVNQGASCAATVAIVSPSGPTPSVTAGVSDGSGNTYLAARICGTSPGASSGAGATYGIVKVDGAGNLTHIAGNASGSESDNIGATTASVDGFQYTLIILNGYLYYFDNPTTGGVNHPRLRKINLGTNIVTTVAGGLPLAAGGDYGLATQTPLNWVGYGLGGVNNNIVFFEGVVGGDQQHLRMIWSP